jgi:hypothetical protein
MLSTVGVPCACFSFEIRRLVAIMLGLFIYHEAKSDLRNDYKSYFPHVA